jgi:hypothetical protein
MWKPLIVSCAWMMMSLLAHGQSNRVAITDDGTNRIITSNGIPEHKTGRFPNKGNPNSISAQLYTYRMPLYPRMKSRPVPLEMRMAFGVAINGVPLDPGAAEFWNNDWNSGWQYEAMSGRVPLGIDQNNAHVQPNGAYHYHGLPPYTVANAGGAVRVSQMRLFGYAADGFPIYALYGHSEAKNMASSLVALKSSYQLKKGTRPSGPGGRYDGSFVADYEYVEGSGDLDECNGRIGVTPDYPEGTYYYVLTREFPFIPRFFRGLPDNSFMKGPPGGGPDAGGRRGPGGPGGRPPHPPPHHRPGDGPPPPRR